MGVRDRERPDRGARGERGPRISSSAERGRAARERRESERHASAAAMAMQLQAPPAIMGESIALEIPDLLEAPDSDPDRPSGS